MKKDDFSTRAVHAGTEAHPAGALSMPIFQTSTFRFSSAAHGAQQSSAKAPPDFYTRWGNPTTRRLELALADLEGGAAALCLSSGMAAGSTAVLSQVKAGDHIVAAECLYAGMTEFFARWLPRFGVETSFVDGTDLGAVEAAIKPNTRLLYVETPANPTLALTDLGGAAAIAKRHSLVSIADNTWASPANQRPLEHGIDMVVHSVTKYLGGHSDVVSGAIVGGEEHIHQCWSEMKLLGGCPSPNDAWLVLRGIKTLALRTSRQNETAQRLALFLEAHPAVRRVYYPGLASHPQHALASAQMLGFGGMLAFELVGGLSAGQRFLEAVTLAIHAVSLGGAESLVSHPASTTHASLSPTERQRANIADGLVRLSVGLESGNDLQADLEAAIQAASS